MILALLFAAQLTARVQPTEGGPQIFVNGEAVPPRMFFGVENSVAKKCPAGAFTRQTLAFSSDIDTDNATIHIRFDMTPGTITRLRNFKFYERGKFTKSQFDGCLESSENFARCWNVFTGNRDAAHVADYSLADGVCSVTFVAPPKGKRAPDFHFYSKRFHAQANVDYMVEFEAECTAENGRVIPQAYHVDGGGVHNSIVSSADCPLYTTTAKAAAVGVNFVTFMAPREAMWGEKGDNYTSLDKMCDRLIAVNPKVRLLPRLMINAPHWWLKKFPDERMQFAPEHINSRGDSNGALRPNMAAISSRKYQKDAIDYTVRVCKHLMMKYPENFAGIHPCGQTTCEWFYYDSWGKFSGYDPRTVEAFRKYLSDPKAEVPTYAERIAGEKEDHLLDAKTQSRVIAFNRFLQLEMSNFLVDLAAACRKATEDKKLVVFFYGYAYEFGSHWLGPANSGHYGVENLLKKAKGNIDILCSPIAYMDRGQFASAPTMTCAESIMRQGVLWLNEDDTRTYLNYHQPFFITDNQKSTCEESCHMTLRNTAQEIVRGFGSWWMDLPGIGWYDSTELWHQQKLLNRMDSRVAHRNAPYAPETALIQDEESMIHVRPSAFDINGPLVVYSRKTVNRAGLSHGQYLLFDVLEKPIPAKLQIFQSCYNLSADKFNALMTQKRSNPAWRVWCYAAGAQYENGVDDLSRMSRLYNMKMSLVNAASSIATPTEVGISAGLTPNKTYGRCRTPYRRFYTVTDARDDEIWARYPNGEPAIVVRGKGNSGDIFLGVADLSPELVYAFAKIAGAHSYIEADAIGKAMVWATKGSLGDPNGGIGVVQALEDATFSLKLPNKARLFNATNGKLLGEGDSIPLTLAKGDVRVFVWKP